MKIQDKIGELFNYGWDVKKYDDTIVELRRFQEKYEDAVNQGNSSLATKIYRDARRKYVVNCLAPFKFEEHKKTVLVKYLHTESLYDENGGKDVISLAVMTPQMLLTDYSFYWRNAYWKEENQKQLPEAEDFFYKPFYYEFDIYRDDNDNYDELKTQLSRCDNQWYFAELSNEIVDKKGFSIHKIHGYLCFSASKYETQDVFMELLNVVSDDELRQCLIDTNHKPDKFDMDINPVFSEMSGKLKSSSHAVIYNVGQANCIYLYLKLDNNIGFQRVFFDIGRPTDRINSGVNPDLAVGTEVSTNLSNIKLCQPHVIVISHWHKDHFQSALTLGKWVYGETNNCKWLAPLPTDEALVKYGRLINYLVIKKRIRFVKDKASYPSGIVSQNGDVTLYQGQGAKKQLNESSLMLRLNKTLLSADCMYSFWPDCLQNDLSNLEYLVVPHHGSKLGTADLAITNNAQVTKKANAIICAGENTYGHPNQQHVDELKLMKYQPVTIFKNQKNQSRQVIDLV